MPNFKPIVATTVGVGVVGGLAGLAGFAHNTRREHISSRLLKIRTGGIQSMQDANFAAEHFGNLPDGNERQEIRVLVQKYVENDDVIYDLPKATKLRLLWDFSSEFAMLKLLQDEEEIKASALQRIADYEEDFWSTEFDLKLLESHLRNLLLEEKEEKHHSAASTQLTRALDYINRTGAPNWKSRRKALNALETQLGQKPASERRSPHEQNLLLKIRAVKTSYYLKDIIRNGIQNESDADYAVEWFSYLPRAAEREEIKALVRRYLEEDEARIDNLTKDAKLRLLSHFASELAMWKLLRDEDEEVKKAALKRIADHNEANWSEGFDLKLLTYLPELLDSELQEEASGQLTRALDNMKNAPISLERIEALRSLKQVLFEKFEEEPTLTLTPTPTPLDEAKNIRFILHEKVETMANQWEIYYRLKEIRQKKEITEKNDGNFALEHLWNIFDQEERDQLINLVVPWAERNISELTKPAKESLLDLNSEVVMRAFVTDEDEEVRAAAKQALRRIQRIEANKSSS